MTIVINILRDAISGSRVKRLEACVLCLLQWALWLLVPSWSLLIEAAFMAVPTLDPGPLEVVGWALRKWEMQSVCESGAEVLRVGLFSELGAWWRETCGHYRADALMRCLLNFQLAVRAPRWDEDVAVTGSLCDITSSPCCHSSCNHPVERVPQGDGKPRPFPLKGIHGPFFHAKEKES